MRRAKAFSISDPLGTEPHGKGGVSDPMRKVDDMVDGEAEDATYGWARDALALFDLMAAANKPLFRGQLLSGLDIAEMKYRLGATDAEVMRSFAIGKSKLHEDLGALVDYLDYIGPERAFHVDGDDVEPEEALPDSAPTGPHGSAYGDIEALSKCPTPG